MFDWYIKVISSKYAPGIHKSISTMWKQMFEFNSFKFNNEFD